MTSCGRYSLWDPKQQGLVALSTQPQGVKIKADVSCINTGLQQLQQQQQQLWVQDKTPDLLIKHRPHLAASVRVLALSWCCHFTLHAAPKRRSDCSQALWPFTHSSESSSHRLFLLLLLLLVMCCALSGTPTGRAQATAREIGQIKRANSAVRAQPTKLLLMLEGQMAQETMDVWPEEKAELCLLLYFDS